jgi:hypothetical protein
MVFTPNAVLSFLGEAKPRISIFGFINKCHIKHLYELLVTGILPCVNVWECRALASTIMSNYQIPLRLLSVGLLVWALYPVSKK